MSLAKYLNRFTTIHHKIRTRSTGTPKQLAAELHISESRLLDNLADLKAMGAPIEYDKEKKTYYYTHEVDIVIKFEG